MQSKLDKLVADPSFGTDANDFDAGSMIYDNKISLDYIILRLDGYYKVYLSYFDDNNDHLVSSKSTNLDVAKNLATEKIEKLIRHLL